MPGNDVHLRRNAEMMIQQMGMKRQIAFTLIERMRLEFLWILI